MEQLPAHVRRFVENVQRLAPGIAPLDVVLSSLAYTEANPNPLITEEEYQALAADQFFGKFLDTLPETPLE